MTNDQGQDRWPPIDGNDVGDLRPATEPKGALVPPPPKPPTAVGLEISGPEPDPKRERRQWRLPPRRSDVPPAVARAIDSILDVLDSVADSIRSTAERLAG